LINVKDMARAIEWAIGRQPLQGGEFLAVNVGSDEWNYQVKDLAQGVADIIPDIDISINQNAPPDKRSYRVSFELFSELAPDHQPKTNLLSSIRELQQGLDSFGFADGDFRNSNLMRLHVLMQLKEKALLDENLSWVRWI
jgi:nucleoside-diphosphate-sugar epimerase